MVKSLKVFFSKVQFTGEFFFQILFNLGNTFAAHHEKSFVPAFLGSILITY